ncbi:MAG: GspH/FimT family pseudopilin [Hahellaceae bacterium]|nr:GspH/FimT family pseudopilin [Hahellaceae bacterium]MCP5210641.1 GspH/FimT family pseudopilin [Hahellaceae bacterium]
MPYHRYMGTSVRANVIVPTQHSHSQKPVHRNGFTLIELLCTLAIIAVLLGIAVPSMTTLLQQSRSTAFANELTGLVNATRQLAVSSQTVTTFCPTIDYLTCSKDWSQGAMVFTDENANLTLDDNDQLFRVLPALKDGNKLYWRAFQNKQLIQFSPMGYTRSQNGTFTFCPHTGGLTTTRLLIVNKSGRVRPGTDKNNDGIQEQPNGKAPDCEA